MWLVERVARRARRVGGAAQHRLDGLLVDEAQVHDVPAAVEAGEDGAAVAGRAPVLHGDDLGEEDAGVLGDHLAGLAGDGHAERAEVAARTPA